MLITVGAGLLAICGRPATPVRWCAFIGIGAVLLRLGASGWFGMEWPSAESGLGAFLLARPWKSKEAPVPANVPVTPEAVPALS